MSTTTLQTMTVPTDAVQIDDLVRIDESTEVEVTGTPRRSLFGHGWMISGRKVVDGIPEAGDYLHQTDADTVVVWR